jgi:selenocysteine-specific elongation factor
VIARLIASGTMEQVAEGLRPGGHRPQFSVAEERLAEAIIGHLQPREGTPPKLEALAKMVGQPTGRVERFMGELARAGQVVRLAHGAYVARRTIDEWRGLAERIARQRGNLTLGEFRNAIGVGRELALLALEYFDRVGVTRRIGDTRVMAAKAQPAGRA